MDENTQRKQELERIAGVLRQAMREQKLTNKALASHFTTADGKPMHESMVSQWVTARKPIAPEHVDYLASILKVSASSLQVGQPRRGMQNVVQFAVPDSNPPDHELIRKAAGPLGETPEQTIHRLKDQVFALTVTTAILAGVMREHRPLEAKAAAEQLRKRMPAWVMRDGFLADLLKALERQTH